MFGGAWVQTSRMLASLGTDPKVVVLLAGGYYYWARRMVLFVCGSVHVGLSLKMVRFTSRKDQNVPVVQRSVDVLVRLDLVMKWCADVHTLFTLLIKY